MIRLSILRRAFLRGPRVWLVAIALSIATSASAQGPPPFELGSAGTSNQIVEMELAIRDITDEGDTITVFTDVDAYLNRSQDGNGSGEGSLTMFPGGISFGFMTQQGQFVAGAPLCDEGTRSFFVYESPVVTGGNFAPFFTTGELFYDTSDPGPACSAYLEGGLGSAAAILSESDSSYDVQAGVLEARARASSPDYGEERQDGPTRLRHRIFARTTAGIADWVYATGSGVTATIVVTALIDSVVDAPDANADDGLGLSDWITQAYGDLRDFDECSGPPFPGQVDPSVDQQTRFSLEVQIRNGSNSLLGSQSALREREMGIDFDIPVPCSDELPVLVATDTGVLPPTVTVQTDVPTNQWVLVSASLLTESQCEGAMACDLVARTGAPTQVSITSPNGTLFAWQGIAGLTRVPEPAGGASFTAALGAIALLARRRARIGGR